MQAIRQLNAVAGSTKPCSRPLVAPLAAVPMRVVRPRTAFAQAPQRMSEAAACIVPRLVVCMAAMEDAAPDVETPSNRLFVGNLSWDTSRDTLGDHFESCEGFVSARVAWDMDRQRSRGFGFVEFQTPEQAEAALQNMSETELDGRNVLVRYSTAPARPRREGNDGGRREYNNDRNSRYPQRERSFGDGDRPQREPRQPKQEQNPDTTLFVGNLPFSTRWQELKDLFAESGNVEFVDMAMGRDGRPRGFATIRMSTPDAAETAIAELNGHELEGRPMTVRKYEARTYG